jgi:hypothetical protein
MDESDDHLGWLMVLVEQLGAEGRVGGNRFRGAASRRALTDR